MSVVELELERGSNVAWLTVDNPPVNALSDAVIGGLVEALDKVGASQAKVMVLQGARDTFIAGADISAFPALLGHPDRALAHVESTRPMFAKLASIPQVVVAAVRGSAVGGGLELALASDLVVAEVLAKLGLPEIRLGLIPGGGGTQRLPRAIGRMAAARMIFEGSLLSGAEAYRLGLVSHLAPKEAFDTTLRALTEKLARLPRHALIAAKRSLREGVEMPLAEALKLEESLFLPLLATDDAREGYEAFMGKRRPNFQ